MAPYWLATSQTAKFMGPTWGPSGSCRPQMGPMFAPWTLLSGLLFVMQDPGGLISTSLELYTQLWLALFYCYLFLYINIIYPYSALGHMSKMNWCQTIMKYDKVHTARILWNVLTKCHYSPFRSIDTLCSGAAGEMTSLPRWSIQPRFYTTGTRAHKHD